MPATEVGYGGTRWGGERSRRRWAAPGSERGGASRGAGDECKGWRLMGKDVKCERTEGKLEEEEREGAARDRGRACGRSSEVKGRRLR
eukprot:1479568-Rhodomonas_salina.1